MAKRLRNIYRNTKKVIKIENHNQGICWVFLVCFIFKFRILDPSKIALGKISRKRVFFMKNAKKNPTFSNISNMF